MKKVQAKKAPRQDEVKLSFRRHIVPPLIGMVAMATVWGVFNSQLIAAKLIATVPSQSSDMSQVNSASTQVDTKQAPTITIDDIEVNAPVIYGETETSESSFQKVLQNGVVHYPGTATPGQAGNVVIFGHSSGQIWAPGKYKFVFTKLEQLNAGDKIYLQYKGVRYVYEVEGKSKVEPTDVSVLQPTKTNTLTLITCTPVGTDRFRLIVTAEQIAPTPATNATTQQTTVPPTEIYELPNSKSPSIWQSIKSYIWW